MGQLFQPTNIIPNVLGEFGQGVADVTKPLTISWQVNGNVPMTKYRIRLFHYLDDNVSGQIEVTLDTPFYGRDEDGNVVRFSHTIKPVDMSSAWENGRPCKYTLTLFWGNGEGESVTTLSKCVFLARETPTLSLGSIDNPYTSKDFSTTATYTQANGDGILWAQWQFADMSKGEPIILRDTGRMYGVSQLAFSSDNLLNGGLYGVRCMVETESGATVETAWSVFEAEYTVESGYDTFTVMNPCNDGGNISVSWADYRYFPAVKTGYVTGLSVTGFKIWDEDSSIVWNTVDQSTVSSLRIQPKWTVIYRGSISPASETDERIFKNRLVIYLTEANAITSISVSINKSGTLDFDYNFGVNAVTIASKDGITEETEIVFALTPTKLLFSINGEVEQINLRANAYADKEIRQISAVGTQLLNFLIVQDGEVTEEYFKDYFVGSRLQDIYNKWMAPYRFFAHYKSAGDYNAGLNAENANFLKSYSLYREEPGSSTLIPVTDESANTINILDYGARNGKGPFTYHLFVELSTGMVKEAISKPVNLCYWSYILLSCTKNENGEYIVQKSYRFRYNIETGAISNNNRPSILDSFTRYPLVQMANNNYKTGSLQGLIGTVSGCDAQYDDTLAMRDELMGLSASPNYLFIKDRKGDLIMIRPAGEVTIEVGDTTAKQEQRINFPWVEVGSADGVSVYEIV